MTGVLFVALVIAGFGVTSLIRDEDTIPIRGLGPLPGIVALVVAVIIYAWLIGRSLSLKLSYSTAFWAAVACYLSYVMSVALTALVAGPGVAVALAAMSSVAAGWPGVIVAVMAFMCAWLAITLVRSRAPRPQWPWESASNGDE